MIFSRFVPNFQFESIHIKSSPTKTKFQDSVTKTFLGIQHEGVCKMKKPSKKFMKVWFKEGENVDVVETNKPFRKYLAISKLFWTCKA